jgi:hypothetical protein
MTEPVAAADAAKKPPLKVRLKKLIEDYGWLAIGLYFGLSFLTMLGATLAIGFGLAASDASDFVGVLVAAWLVLKATMVIRIPIILAITPPIGGALRRRRARRIAAGLEYSDEELAAIESMPDDED